MIEGASPRKVATMLQMMQNETEAGGQRAEGPFEKFLCCSGCVVAGQGAKLFEATCRFCGGVFAGADFGRCAQCGELACIELCLLGTLCPGCWPDGTVPDDRSPGASTAVLGGGPGRPEEARRCGLFGSRQPPRAVLVSSGDPTEGPRRRDPFTGVDDGDEDGAFLKHDVYAEPLFKLFLPHFGARLPAPFPMRAVHLLVYSRFDSDVLPPSELWMEEHLKPKGVWELRL